MQEQEASQRTWGSQVTPLHRSPSAAAPPSGCLSGDPVTPSSSSSSVSHLNLGSQKFTVQQKTTISVPRLQYLHTLFHLGFFKKMSDGAGG